MRAILLLEIDVKTEVGYDDTNTEGANVKVNFNGTYVTEGEAVGFNFKLRVGRDEKRLSKIVGKLVKIVEQ